MRPLRPTQDQESDIQEMLRSRIGPVEYDQLFRILVCGEIRAGVAHVYVLNEFHALQVEALYSHDIAKTVAQIMACEVTSVSVWPLAFSDRPVTDGASRATRRNVISSDS